MGGGLRRSLMMGLCGGRIRRHKPLIFWKKMNDLRPDGIRPCAQLTGRPGPVRTGGGWPWP